MRAERAGYSRGGYIPGDPIPYTVATLRHVETGLSVVSIDNGRPEYLISQDWIRRNPGKVPLGMPPEPPEAKDWENMVSMGLAKFKDPR